MQPPPPRYLPFWRERLCRAAFRISAPRTAPLWSALALLFFGPAGRERERERRHSNFQTEKIVQKRKQIRTSSSSIPSQNHHPTNRSAVKGPPSVCVFPRRLNGIRSRLPPRRLDRIRLRFLRRFDGIRRCACCERQLRSRDPLSVAAVTVLAVILPSCSPRWRRQGGWGERESRGSTTRVEEKVSRERPHGDLSRSCPWRRGSFPARLAP